MINLENKFLLAVKTKLRHECPYVFELFIKLASRTLLFKNERLYYKSKHNVSNSTIESLILLSQPRGGTQVCEHIISAIYKASGGTTLHLGKFFFWYDSKLIPLLRNEKWVAKNLITNGYFFGNFGSFSNIKLLPRLKYIVMCRDPRDVLLSHYYSLRDAHIANSKSMRLKVEQARTLTVDQYVSQKEIIADVKSYLHQAIKMKESDHDILFCKYETMIDNPKQFINDVVSFTNCPLTADLETELLKPFSYPVKKEELTTRHRRSGKYNQYKAKLLPETQSFLANEFSDEIDALAYEK